MPAPNIDMIAASLRSCSLSGRERRAAAAAPPPPPPPRFVEESDENEVVTVELNSDVALPYHWEQCLDMRTGEVYYINWKDGTRTSEDPRRAARMGVTAVESYYYSDDDGNDEESSDDDGDDDSDSGGDTTSYSSGVSSVSSPSPGETLVAAGCKGCFMYFMVPKRVEGCPKCGGGLLHLGRRNGCF